MNDTLTQFQQNQLSEAERLGASQELLSRMRARFERDNAKRPPIRGVDPAAAKASTPIRGLDINALMDD